MDYLLDSMGQIHVGGTDGLLSNTGSIETSNETMFNIPTFYPDRPCNPAPQTCDPSAPVVPNIVHLIWFFEAGTKLRFHQLASFLSALRIQRPKEIWFWYDEGLPAGPYWWEFVQEVNRSQDTNLVQKKTKKPTHILRQKISVYPEHASDWHRINVMLEHGGIYMDNDMLLLRNLKPLMCYNLTMARARNMSLDNGFIIARPGSAFIKLWRKTYEHYSARQVMVNSVINSLELYKQHPDLVHVETECLLRPSGSPVEVVYQREDYKYFDWSRHYGNHLWRGIKGTIDKETIKTAPNTISQILYYIYYQVKRNDTLNISYKAE